MTMFDEATLRAALHEAADGFAPSDESKDEILTKARSSRSDRELSHTGRLVSQYGRGRSLLGAVAAGVVVFLISVPLLHNEVASPPNQAVATTRHGLTISGTGLVNINGAAETPRPPTVQGSATGSVTLINGTGRTKGISSGVTASLAQAQITSSLKVEETGTVNLSVSGRNFEMDLSRLNALATSDSGYVAQTHAHIGSKSSGSYSSGFVIIEVPVHSFARLVTQVRQVGHATSVVTSAIDVTGQYVDLQARIHALQVSRQQYLTIMTRTNSINGILAVQSQLNSIQSQIEQLQGSFGLLNSATTYGSLTVVLTQSGVTPLAHHATSGVTKAWHDSIHGFVAGFEWLIRLGGPLLFALLCLAALLFLGRSILRATRRRRTLS